VFALGATSWKIEDITHDRVLVSPAPGQPGRLPFWHGDALGRPAELGRAVGAFVRAVASTRDAAEVLAGSGLDERASANLVQYVHEQRDATSVVPSDTTVVVERFRDELGDWRVVVHTPFGATVHAPWALVIGARIRDAIGIDAQVMHADDGIVLRLPDVDDEESARSVMDHILIEPEEIEALVTAEVGGSALFASRFRECAARALLLPRRRPDRRTPLWQQRQRSAHLLGVASDYASFPILLETVRECLQDVYDVPALREVLTELRDGRIRVHEASTEHPSPFAQSLLFGYVASFLYEGDSPLAERRAQALTLDPALLAELLGTPELRDLLDADALDEVEAELQHLTPATAARDVEHAADLLRLLGPLSDGEATARGIDPAWLRQLCSERRAIRIRTTGEERTAAIEDAGRLRDALGIALPVGVPDAHLAIVADPLGDVVGRYARTHGPFTPDDAATGLGLPPGVAREVLARLAAAGRLVRGEFRPLTGAGDRAGLGASPTEYCDVEVLRRIRRRSIARLRHEIEPVPAARYAAFLPRWQRVTASGGRSELRGVDGCYEVIEQLAGTALPASTWLRSVLPARVDDVHDGMLDELIGAGDVVWWGVSALSGGDGVVCLAPTDRAALLRRPPTGLADDPAAVAVTDALAAGGAQFFRDLADRVGAGRADSPVATDAELVETLWRLVWSGAVTNDGWSALRARIDGTRARPATRRGRPGLPQRSGPPAGAGRWSLLPTLTADPTAAATAVGQALLDRHGIVTRGTVVSERIDGGFARMYRVLSAFEDAGRCRRTYAIEGLGAAQFALAGAVDRLRATPRAEQMPTVLAATDPASAYGAALPWPALAVDVGHRPGRKAGAVVVTVDGELVLYLERGGRSLLMWEHGEDVLRVAAAALVRDGQRMGMDRAVIAKVNGAPPAPDHTRLLTEAGFLPTPRGLRPPRS
jgi:ATP-dependent Lhr-like helicase